MFPSGIAVQGGSSNITLRSNTSVCPRCKAPADIVDGVFDFTTTGNFVQTGGRPVDPQLFARIGLVLLQAKLDGASPGEIVERVGAHSPKLAEQLNAIRNDPQAFATMLAALLAAIVAIALAAAPVFASAPTPPTVEQYITVVNRDELQRSQQQLQMMEKTPRPLPTWTSEYF